MNYYQNLKKILTSLTVVVFITITILFGSCSTKNEWQKATVVYSDDFSKDVNVLVKRSTYYTFIKAKSDNPAEKTEILIPEEVKLVTAKDFTYVSMFFDEKNYGMESWSFGKVLAGDTVMLAETKYQLKTCACKTAGKFFHGYFLVCGTEHLKIKTDSKNNVYNRAQIYEFVDKFSETSLPKEINNISDLIVFLENINN